MSLMPGDYPNDSQPIAVAFSRAVLQIADSYHVSPTAAAEWLNYWSFLNAPRELEDRS